MQVAGDEYKCATRAAFARVRGASHLCVRKCVFGGVTEGGVLAVALRGARKKACAVLMLGGLDDVLALYIFAGARTVVTITVCVVLFVASLLAACFAGKVVCPSSSFPTAPHVPLPSLACMREGWL